MGEATKIAWTDRTFNPWIGCAQISEGCRHCYAKRLAEDRMGLRDRWGPAGRRVSTSENYWRGPGKWNANGAGRVFCGSMCDVFEDHPETEAIRRRLWYVIRATNRLTWQLLTKRPENIARMLPLDWGEGWPHVWLGTTVEGPAVFDRADALRKTPSVTRFISYEPAVGSPAGLDLTGIDWLIYGGETGPGWRQDNDEWARDALKLARKAGTAFFYKQCAGWKPETRITLDGKEIREFPSR